MTMVFRSPVNQWIAFISYCSASEDQKNRFQIILKTRMRGTANSCVDDFDSLMYTYAHIYSKGFPQKCAEQRPLDADGERSLWYYTCLCWSHGCLKKLMPQVKVMQCWRCKAYGHRTGDRECPLGKAGNIVLDAERQVDLDGTNYSLESAHPTCCCSFFQ